MRDIVGIITMIFILIGIYLFIRNSKDSVAIINSIATNATRGIATLQGNYRPS